MKKELEYLIELTNDFLNDTSKPIKENIDYNLLLEFANAHNLASVVFSVIKNAPNFDSIDEHCRFSASECFYDSIFIYENQKRTIEKVYDILSSNGIRHVFFKGAIIKELYPVPECRVMGDADVLIDKKDRSLAKTALIRAGFACTAQNGPVMEFCKGDINLEVHLSMTGSEEKYAPAFNDAMSTAQYEGFCGKPEDNLHFAFMIAHTAHHFLFYGAGIRMVLDIAVMLKKCDIDLDTVMLRLDKIGLREFGEALLSVCYKWYNVGKSYCDVSKECENFLTEYGVFGNFERNKSAVLARKELAAGNDLSPFAAKLKLIFPSYSRMKNIPYIKFINGRPWLLVYAWVYRLIYNIIYRKNFLTEVVRGLDDEKTKQLAKSELKLFEEIGLQ